MFAKKLPEALPAIISKVAIVTSAHGAALRDIISTLNRRAPHIQIFVSSCRVQGDGSSESIKVALKRVESVQQTEKFDVVIVSRGGGSIEDLWSFNNEELCRYVSELKLPVVSGVGHETDFTLLDFVSNIRAETPTAAAEIVSRGRI